MNYTRDLLTLLMAAKAMLQEDEHPPLDLGTGARPAKENLRQEFRSFEMKYGTFQ